MAIVRNESEIYQFLKNGFQFMPIIMQRIESHGTGLGIPDIAFNSKDNCGWIEDKKIDRLPTIRFKIPFREGQYAWIKRWRRINRGKVFVIILLGAITKTPKLVIIEDVGIHDREYNMAEIQDNRYVHIFDYASKYVIDIFEVLNGRPI